jgi:uncharacterized protein (DUF58 family)
LNLVLEPREFKMLDGLRLNPRKAFAGRVRGERLTRKKGISIEFADYREYSDGDDLRHLDWNVLARLDSAVIRTYQDEEDLAMHLLLDLSPSMEFGEPSKLDQARKLACAIGYVALGGGDAVLPRALGPKEPDVRALRGRVGFPRLAQWCETARPPERNRETLTGAIRGFINASVRAGVAMLIADGLDPDFPGLLRALGGRGHEVWLLQVLSDIELDPDLEGDLRLLDAESGKPVEVTANSYVLKEYRRRLQEHNSAIVEAIRRIGGRHALIRADQSLDSVIKETFKREGWVA